MANHNFMTLTPSKATTYVYETLSNEWTRRFRILFHGEPGVGKSAVMKKVALLMGATLIDLRLLQLDLGAMRGLERIVHLPGGKVETHPARPYFLPEYVADEDITDETPRYIIFLDEIMAADDSIRKCAFELLTDDRIGPHRIGKNVMVVGAGNSAEDGTLVYEMDWATRDRFVHVKIEASQDELVSHANDNEWHHHVVSLIRNQAGAILPAAEDKENDNLAAPSPRSLEAISRNLKAFDEKKISEMTRDVNIHGLLGSWAADLLIELISDEESQFSLDELVKARPEDRKYPTNPFGTYSLAGALAAWATDADKLDIAMGVMLDLPNTTNSSIEEAKTAFIHNIGGKMREWRLFPKYARDPRVLPFLAETAAITEDADREFAERQAQGEREAA
jgi:MoxR-like ATPase